MSLGNKTMKHSIYQLMDEENECFTEFKIIGIGETGKKAIEVLSKNIHFINDSNIAFHSIDEEDDSALIQIQQFTLKHSLVIFLTDHLQKVKKMTHRVLYTDYIVITSQTFDEINKIRPYSTILSYCDAVVAQQKFADFPLQPNFEDTTTTFFYWTLRAITDRLQTPGCKPGDYEEMACMLFGANPIFVSVGVTIYDDCKNAVVNEVCEQAISNLNKNKLTDYSLKMHGILATLSPPNSANNYFGYGILECDELFEKMESFATGEAYSKCCIALQTDTNYADCLMVMMLVSYTQ